MEQKVIVKPVGIKYICDVCKEGEMIQTAYNDWESNPPRYEHICTNCSTKIYLNEKYPLIRYEL
ncbi:hypothetical protein IAI10_24015 [Clostridium sp. 19966]|uniref:hypothetical protein n=1 Tax=Clostridium sp. 19966 TaxID=2768166 RepID=UPI0028DFCF90|nr:hypothetical protein [Clostridium sp. 19966]MDT8719706.1 hypothetical protein [Clostridium sp. 19966]